MRDLNSLNRVILVGNLVKKPELRYLPKNNRAVASFQVATNESVYYPDTKQTSQRTEFHRIVAWGKLAEFCQRYLDQGRQVLIEGKLRNRSWAGRDGNKRYTTEVEAQMLFCLAAGQQLLKKCRLVWRQLIIHRLISRIFQSQQVTNSRRRVALEAKGKMIFLSS